MKTKDRMVLALAAAGIVIFLQAGIAVSLIIAATAPGFLVGRVAKKNWVAYAIAVVAIVAVLRLVS